jgi:hypothetical protein
MRSPLALSKRAFEATGHVVGIVERRIGAPGETILSDLFGIFDLVAMKEGTTGLTGIQTTSGSNISSRVHKIMESDHVRT